MDLAQSSQRLRSLLTCCIEFASASPWIKTKTSCRANSTRLCNLDSTPPAPSRCCLAPLLLLLVFPSLPDPFIVRLHLLSRAGRSRQFFGLAVTSVSHFVELLPSLPLSVLQPVSKPRQNVSRSGKALDVCELASSLLTLSSSSR